MFHQFFNFLKKAVNGFTVMGKIQPEELILIELRESIQRLDQLKIDMKTSTIFWKKLTVSLEFLSLTSNI
jgi:hypothetical protein